MFKLLSLCAVLAFADSVLAQPPRHRIATFTADVTPPIGHPCMGGGIAPVKAIADPLYAHGFVILGDAKPIVVVAVDWCEIRNDAYDRWRAVLARAAGTDPVRVLVTAVHQHDAPIADLTAQKFLDRHTARGRIVDLEFHERTVERVAKSLAASMKSTRPVSHFGIGEAKVAEVASNRRYLDDDGKPRHNRMSRTRDASIRNRPEGTIDPWLKTLSFWNGDQAIAALSVYATHPMSTYGAGNASSDFVGLARRRRQAEEPETLQLYASGCSGNVTAGKYNDGDSGPLADRLHAAMKSAWRNTRRVPMGNVTFRSTTIPFEPRVTGAFTTDALQSQLTDPPPQSDPLGFRQCLAAFGLSWRARLEAKVPVDLPVIDLGGTQLVLLPGEAYVDYQLLAQKLRPDSFVIVMGYGECGTGYIPTEQAFRENDSNLSDWCWVAPGCERAMREALERAFAE
jgi:hypothetical protein